MANDANNYLQYLDKEMTIMGILSTFCVAVVALVLDRVGSTDSSKQTIFYLLWKDQSSYIVLGSSRVALAAALVYHLNHRKPGNQRDRYRSMVQGR